MSRIIVKNLPAKATESDLKAHFQSKGVITDVKVLRKRDGSSRRFAFVGFKSDSEAEQAAKYFNLSFMNSSRLDVSLAKPLGDEELEKRKESLKRKRMEKQSEELSSVEAKKLSTVKDKKNEQLEEFLKVMQPQKTTAMWKNDSTETSAGPMGHKAKEESDDDVNDLDQLQHEGAADNEDEEMNDQLDERVDEKSEEKSEEKQEEEEEPDWDPAANIEEESESTAPAISDEEWLRQRQTRIKDNGEKPEPQPVDIIETELEDTEQPEQGLESVENTATNRLFVRNLAFTVTRQDLQTLFGQFGTIKQVHIPLDPRTDKQKGIAFIEFEDTEEATNAFTTLDGSSFQGRLMHIIYASEQRGYVLDEFDIKNMPLKKQKALKRRMQAAKQQFSWNSLYMNRNTVLEATAAKLGISKSEMMDPHSSNMAVQQALAESSVLENVQNYFRSKGVDLNKFQPGKAQDMSDTVILAKNLPFSVSAPEIQDMFSAYGEVERTLMPPDGGMAIIQFKLASDGRNAFKKLAFRRVGESILYLQKAPKGVMPEQSAADKESTAKDVTTKEAPASVAPPTSATDILLPGAADAVEGEADIRASVFVKNLNFATTLTSLVKVFQAVPGFITAVIKTKPDPQDKTKQHSMGFGFVEFRTLSQAQAAIKAMDGHELDGHKLQLKISSRGKESAAAAGKGSSSGGTKILIKNIPFEATKQDIVELFGTFGHLRSVRVPKKFNRQSRGFAFAEFATPKEAEHALDALRGAHLLGRRLVMDYAQADAEDAEDEISRMEAKVSQQVSAVDSQSRRLGGQQKGFDMDEE